nr:AEC family transporter [Actibacterium sp. 188UL27-1]
MILTVLQVVAPVIAIAGLGFGWIRLGFDYPVAFVTRLAMTLAVPCLIFTALVDTELEAAALTAISVATIVAYAGVTLMVCLIGWLSGLDRRTYWAPLIFGNTGNVGLPLALFAFGEEGLALAVVVFAIMAMGTFTYGIWLVSGSGAPGRVLREPILIGTVLGALFLSQGWQVPGWLGNMLDLIGQMAIPLMLLTLGVAVGRMSPGTLWRPIWLSLLKAGLSAAIAVGVGMALDLSPVALGVLVLQLITPVAVTSYMLAERYQAGPQDVAGLVVVSTLLSIVTFPLALAFLL